MQVSKFYYINLDKRPNRNEHFLNQCKRENVPEDRIKRFVAIDGDTHVFTPEENKLFEKSDLLSHWFGNRIKGNQLSHHYIMKEVIKNKYPYAVVFQDDAILRESFMEILENVIDNLPKTSEMVNIGFHTYASGATFVRWDLKGIDDHVKLAEKRLNKYVCVLKHGINPCSLAYIITLKGAEKMVKYFETNGFSRATDGNFNDYLETNGIFYGSTPVLVTGNSDLKSDIFLK
jgi:GR25 family glycosyltransferase involved in LPS biosynthesis